MMWMNKNLRYFVIYGFALVVLIFVLPYIWPVNPEWYFSNLNWMIPLVIIVFIAPIVPFILSNWDIHFSFKYTEDKLIATLSNHGTTPYGFNRVQFASSKYRIFGKRFGKSKFYPDTGICDDADVKVYGSDTSEDKLRGHQGCTLRKGLPITLTISNHKAQENLRNFKGNERVCLSLYYEGTNQRVYSQPIQRKIITNICHNKD